jgi:hypothetical protein
MTKKSEKNTFKEEGIKCWMDWQSQSLAIVRLCNAEYMAAGKLEV